MRSNPRSIYLVKMEDDDDTNDMFLNHLSYILQVRYKVQLPRIASHLEKDKQRI